MVTGYEVQFYGDIRKLAESNMQIAIVLGKILKILEKKSQAEKLVDLE